MATVLPPLDVAVGISSAGTTQATATTLPSDHCCVSTVTLGQGVILKAGNSGDGRTVTNESTTASLLVYPPVGSSLNGLAANTPLMLPPNRAARFQFFTATKISVFY